ncbi:MAG TPA: phenylalanine--tRNA ligase subunit beta [Candidatus Acidoferrales bacterium]
MKVLHDWLKEFAELTLPVEELRARLTLAGIAVEGLAQTAAGPLLDADLTINRPDCLGHYGMAREAAAIERKRLRPVEVKLTEAAETAAKATRVEIECPDLCGRYTARVLRGLKIGPSPARLRQRLEALGQASINNVVDATNYVMLELGQPLHAFDFDRLAERRIIVRRARAGEKMRTLDGIERALAPEMCLIADAARPVAIGGVMGGAESEIGAGTRNVLLESAWFDPISTRRTSKTLGLRSEASTRFERGADPEMAELASRRCAGLIQELAGGEILAGVVDAYPGRRERLRLELSRKEFLRVMGSDVPNKEIEAILDALGFAPRRVDAARGTPDSLLALWECRQPSWRQDVTREVDLVEEVARHYGLEKFPPRLHASRQPAARLPHAEAFDRLRERLIGLGYREIVSIPLVNAEEDALFAMEGAAPVAIANPLAEDASRLRSSGLVSMAQALAWNLNHGQRNVRLFEVGRAYRWKDGAPEETPVLTLGATGLAREKGVAESEREYSFADLKGELDQIGELAGGLVWSASPPARQGWQHRARCGQFAPLATAGIAADCGTAGELSRRVAERFKLRQPVFLAELALDPFYAACEAAGAGRGYQPISRYPAVERDFSLVLRDGTPFAGVREAIASLAISEIVSVEAVDLFRGKHVPQGNFSLLVRVTFQSHQATLTEAQVNECSVRIVATLEQRLGAALRTA